MASLLTMKKINKEQRIAMIFDVLESLDEKNLLWFVMAIYGKGQYIIEKKNGEKTKWEWENFLAKALIKGMTK